MIKIMDSKGVHDKELPFYKIQNLCEVLTNKAIENEYFAYKYETLYVNRVTKFSPEIEFCMNELGVAIPYPFKENSYIFSSGKMHYVGDANVINQVGKNRRMITSPNGFPKFTDENLGVNKTIDSIEEINQGIIDEDSFISSKNFKGNEELSKIYLLKELTKNEELYNDFITNRSNYASNVDYSVDKLGIVEVSLNANNEIEFKMGDNVIPGARDIVGFLSGENVMINSENQGLSKCA